MINVGNPRIIPKITLAFIVGIIVAYFWDLNYKIILLLLFLSFGSAIYSNNSKRKSFFIFIMIIFFSCTGYLFTTFHLGNVKELYTLKDTEQNLRAMVLTKETYNFGNIYILTDLIISEEKYPGKISLLLYGHDHNFSYGDILQLKGKLKLPPQARNPGEVDIRQYLLLKGIGLQIAAQPDDIKLLQKSGMFFTKVIIKWRNKVEDLTEKVLPERENAVFNAIVLGNKNYLSDSSRELFAQLGLMHLLAVSGLHTGFVILLLITACKLIKLNYKWEFIVCAGGLLFYSALTAFAAPVVRASIMGTIVLLGKLIKREHKYEEMLAVAAFIILLHNPLQLFMISFQLTFAATMGIIYLTPIFEAIFSKVFGRNVIVKAIVVPAAAFLAITPLAAFYFNRISFVGPLFGILFSPLVGVIVILGVLIVSLSFLPIFVSPFLHLAGGLIFVSLEAMEFFNTLVPKLLLPNIASNLPLVVIAYLMMFATFFIFKYREEPKLLIFLKNNLLYLVAIFFICLVGSLIVFDNNNLEVTFLDVGQGDAIYIKTPSGKSIIIDGGSSTSYEDKGKEIVIPYLRYLGLNEIDILLNSHPDNDHLGGLFTVVEEFSPQLVILPFMIDNEKYESFIKLLNNKSIQYAFVSKGDILSLDKNIKINILHPPQGHNFSSNNSSLIVKLTYGEIDFLFTGDIESDAQQVLLDSENLESEVLKVPHHGSNDSFEAKFLEKIQPQVAVISVGENNKFGHPGEKIIKWAENNDIKLYRTDLNGAVTIKTDGKSLKIKSQI